jgi:hypothetical protein
MTSLEAVDQVGEQVGPPGERKAYCREEQKQEADSLIYDL